MDIVILKFGGTSVTSFEKKQMIAFYVKQALENNEFPVVVVSAMGRFPDPYATDTLISLVQKNEANDNKVTLDLLMSCGETISATIIANMLDNLDLHAIPVTGFQAGLITDNNFSNANVIDFDGKFINNLIKKKIIPVVTGFQGITKDGFITTLGRGGSDTTATALGSFLNAKRIDIFTDVDGLMDSDPDIFNDAILYEEISYDDAYYLACNGAKVICSKAISYAKKKNIPIYIKNTLKNNTGTLIH